MVAVGASLTALIVTVVVPTLLVLPPSLATNVIIRAVAFGASDRFS